MKRSGTALKASQFYKRKKERERERERESGA
jgi:hypothetical protein